MTNTPDDSKQYSDTDALNLMLKRVAPSGDATVAINDEQLITNGGISSFPVVSVGVAAHIKEINETLKAVLMQLEIITGVDL
jgi:hypothetical protein